jgi:hypothetical protein
MGSSSTACSPVVDDPRLNTASSFSSEPGAGLSAFLFAAALPSDLAGGWVVVGAWRKPRRHRRVLAFGAGFMLSVAMLGGAE